VQLTLLPERGCVEDQPQQLRKPVCWNMSDVAELFNVLRLVLCTQPRSNLVAFVGWHEVKGLE
jgi:hypothetical protein